MSEGLYAAWSESGGQGCGSALISVLAWRPDSKRGRASYENMGTDHKRCESSFDNLSKTKLEMTNNAIICTTKNVYSIEKGVYVIPFTSI